jgi:putative SOS response-associated peptidase YedK
MWACRGAALLIIARRGLHALLDMINLSVPRTEQNVGSWKGLASGEIIRSCSIVTGEPNELVAPIHNRMPVILDQAAWPAWLAETPAEHAEPLALLRPFPAQRMRAYAISPRVGNVRNDDEALLAPFEAAQG